MGKIHYIDGTPYACHHARHKPISGSIKQITCVSCLKALTVANPNDWEIKQQLVNSMSKKNWKRGPLQQLIDMHNLSGRP